MRQILALWMLAVPSGLLWADPQAGPPLAAGYLNQLVGGLVLVVLAIFVLAWLMRRVPGLNTDGGPIQILAARPLGTRERLVLVQVGGDQILIAVSPAGVQHLHTLSQPVEPPALSPAPTDFASWLARYKPRRKGDA
ncbi:flagellar biosynthetic protein FliO [Caldichromatium japonicum]|uniref:Flagellar protein n=1 Tax=Caldichromatium japonicum TaxID=2699430 RepID=A0A6G7VGD2_9GAMM|nr:flagellar biosynthetic protein FliO [Caldichromatium japonicum]QIK38925.1 flagellar biosynthetic protein FliO [Caldichromatium japonicum]